MNYLSFTGDGSFRLKFPQGPEDTGEYVNTSYVEFYELANPGEEFPGFRKDGWTIAALVSGGFVSFSRFPSVKILFGRNCSACSDHGCRTLGQLLHNFYHPDCQVGCKHNYFLWTQDISLMYC